MENNNNRRYWAVLIILLGLILLCLIIYFLFFFKLPVPPAAAPVATTTPKAAQEANLPPAPQVRQLEIKNDSNAKPAEAAAIAKENMTKKAMSFAERFGSYSNQSNFSNILDLKVFMSAAMQKWADNYVAKMREQTKYSGVYQGVITTAVSHGEISLDEAAGKAQIVVSTQKVEVSGNASNPAYYQDIEIDFVKEDGDWKVDSAYWKTKK